jgi:hypothetical protein
MGSVFAPAIAPWLSPHHHVQCVMLQSASSVVLRSGCKESWMFKELLAIHR